MQEEKLSYCEAAESFGLRHKRIQDCERIYQTEGPEGFRIERRGRGRKERRAKQPQKAEEALPAEVQRLRAENAYLKKLASLGFGIRAKSAQKTLVIRGLRQKFKLDILLEVADLVRATYYYHEKRLAKPKKYNNANETIAAIYHENKGRYGYRRITTELRCRDCLLNHKTVQRLMKELGLICRVRMKKYRSYKGEVAKIAPNLLKRNFEAKKPNQKWVIDVTEFSLFGQKLYLSPILDLCSRDIVSYSISDRPILSMVNEMLDKAFEEIPDGTNLILHSDQGWQYLRI